MKKNINRFMVLVSIFSVLIAQGITTAELSGNISDSSNSALEGANIIAVHEPTGTTYGAISRDGGYYNIPNMKVGGPYSVTVSYIGYQNETESNLTLSLGSSSMLNFSLQVDSISLSGVDVIGEIDDVMNGNRTGAATYVGSDQVGVLPSIKRSTRDLTRLDPRSDGNFSFGGRNWLYNSISLDGSYFNNPFGLDDPALEVKLIQSQYLLML